MNNTDVMRATKFQPPPNHTTKMFLCFTYYYVSIYDYMYRDNM